MTVVLDASAALEIVFNGAKSTIYRQTLEKADLVLAPVLFDSAYAKNKGKIKNVFSDIHKLKKSKRKP